MVNTLDPKRGESLWKIRKLAVQSGNKNEFVRPTNAFTFSDVKYLKSGTNSELFLAKNESKQPIAIKMLKPNASKIFSYGSHPRSFFTVEYFSGGTLNDIFKSSTPLLPSSTVLSHAYSLLSALQYLHDAAHPEITIIHRDVKPQNVGFTAGGQLKLFDFGLATCIPRRSVASGSYQLSGLTGTVAYMAPEVALGQPYRESVDIFSFAVVLWQLVTGCAPYSESLTPQEYQEKVATGGLRPSLPPDCGGEGEQETQELRKELLELAGQCWGADPLSRPSAAAAAQTLDQLLLRTTPPQEASGTSSGWRLLGQVAKKLFKSFSGGARL